MRPESDGKSLLGSPLQIIPQGYLLRYFPQEDTSARQRGFEIGVFLILSELPTAIEPHIPVYHLYRMQIVPIKWSSPTSKSLNPIIVITLRVGFP